MVDIFKDRLFTRAEVSTYLKIPRSTVYYWFSANTAAGGAPLVHQLAPEHRGGASVPFAALVEAYVLRVLCKELRLTKRQIVDAVVDVRDYFGTDFALASRRVATEGIDLFLRHSDGGADRQTLIRDRVGTRLRYITWAPDSGYAARLRLPTFSDDAPVVIDPEFGWGAPVVERNKVSVRAVIDLWASGESLATVADEYGLTETEAEAICRAGLKQVIGRAGDS